MPKLCAMLVFLLSPAVSAGADIAGLQVALEEDGVRVSFSLSDAFHPEIVDRIKSGLETTFAVKIRIDQQREYWFNRRVEEWELRLTCTYDSVASAYRVSKAYQGHVYESLVVDTEAEMKTAMSQVSRLKVADNGMLRHDADYILKVKGELMSRYILLVVPWDIDTPWREKRFTFN